MNWGKSIVLVFILFALFVGTLVTITLRQEVSLVSHKYYHDDLAYQQQLDRKNNAEDLEFKPVVTIEENHFLKVYFPYPGTIEGGEVKLFRPSNTSLDQNFRLGNSADSVQVFILKPLSNGAYRVKLNWSMEGKEYYMEKVIVI